MNKRIIATLLFAVLLTLAKAAFTAPAVINYQGVLTNQAGRAINGTADMIFKIYDKGDTSGQIIWSETHTGVTLKNGVYSVLLGSMNIDPLLPTIFTDDESWLEVTVNGEVLTPRQQITSVAYAHNADLLDGLDSTAYLSIFNTSQTALSGAIKLPANGLNVGTNQLVTSNGNLGIGTATPGSKLEIVGDIAVWGHLNNYLGFFYNDNNTNGQNAYGLSVHGDAYDTLTGKGYGGRFTGRGGSENGDAYGTLHYAQAYGTSTAYGVYSSATGGTTTGKEWAFFGYGDGYFSGNVGIGTSSPDVKLEIGGIDSNIRMHEWGGSPYVEIGDDSTAKGYLQWFSSTDRMLLYTSGHAYPVAIGPTASGGVFVDTEANGSNVGIGTTNPDAKLEVSGGVKIANDTSACNSTKAGTIRWSGSAFEGCDGVTWGTLSFSANVPTVFSAGRTWMDRNLGASRVATSSTDSLAYGDLYQWGRGTDGHESRTSATTIVLSTTDDPGHGKFIDMPPASGGIDNYPWDWRSPSNVNLWQGTSGINNPCPTGYRIPSIVEWETEKTSWQSNNIDGAFRSPLKLTAAGGRSSAIPSNTGSTGNYWSSSVKDPVNSGSLYFSSTNAWAIDSGSFRYYGHSVRCIKD